MIFRELESKEPEKHFRYGNTVPKQIYITQEKNAITFETAGEELFPTDIKGKEKKTFDGQPAESTIGKKNRRDCDGNI